ncbi:uncharacterized protein FOMMEDRAFT_171611 [Fomitiporia mediterranea MF3/22]|uniref:Uncharacterized protein n=1 Tax=Fomitiporia mediterranea (strain MF3/22) TaxID=694068 RepID=R7SJB2_FOMME|nr:uncharacterized protein FOMMEDRAFT_171611 [Fomitiporia mediterranea MF3/22]EJC97694.1 hypothetical protein FOMMEDRAFT_171611 [Fomitiporia mediterranea MF3/22]
MPSASSASSTTHTPMSYDKFKPKLPLNPFGDVVQTPIAPPARAPWTLDVHTLPPQSVLQLERRVILVIGQPPAAALAPLFVSPQLASSLLIIASHRPPPLPFDPQPAVHTLRLRTPLSVADAGATRLVEVLEWALQVANLWRRTGGPKKQELMEEVSPASESVPLGQTYGRLRYSATPSTLQDSTMTSAFSPASSVTSLAASTTKKSVRRSLFRRQSSAPLQSDSASTRPFDTLLHFLPADVPDKMKLKAVILVTTLTRPYLATPPARASSTRFYSESSVKPSKRSSSRWSFLRGATGLASPGTTLSGAFHSMSTSNLPDASASRRGSFSTVTLLRTRRSRLIHLVPSPPAKASSSRFPASRSKFMPSQAHLVRSIEAFLLSFCFSAPVDLPPPIAGFASGNSDSARARPYVLPATALTEVLCVESANDEDDENERNEDEEDVERSRSNEWSLAELILSGALEDDAEILRFSQNAVQGDGHRSSSESEKGKEKQLENLQVKADDNDWLAHRAWIGGMRDITFMPNSAAKGQKNAHLVPSRSNSPPQLYPEPRAPSSQHASRPSLQPNSRSRHQPIPETRVNSHPDASQPQRSQQRRQTSMRGRTMENLNMNGNGGSNDSHSQFHAGSRRKQRQASAIGSLAIEKRLPTPPEDEDEELGREEEEGPAFIQGQSHSRGRRSSDKQQHMMSQAASYPLSKPEPAHLALRNDRPQQVLRQLNDSHHQQQQHESRPESRSSKSTHPSVPITASSMGASSRYLHQYMPMPPPRKDNNDAYSKLGKEKEHECERALRSLPTPPDSEEDLLFEGRFNNASHSVPLPGPPPLPLSRTSHEREPPIGVVAPVSHEHGRVRSGRQPERSRADGDAGSRVYAKERELELEHRRRTQSSPLRPSQAHVSGEVTAPRRAKTRPKESIPTERTRERTLKKRASDIDLRIDTREKKEKYGMRRSTSPDDSDERRVRRVPVALPPLPPPSPPSPLTEIKEKTYERSDVKLPRSNVP